MATTIKDIVFVYQLKTPQLVRWHSRRHVHGANEFELHYFLGGDGRFEKDAARYVITPGTLHFSPPLEYHAIRPGDIRRPLSYYAVLFSLDDEAPLDPILRSATYADSFPRRVGSHYRVLFEDLKNRYTHLRAARRHAATHMLQSLLWDLAAEAGIDPNPSSESDSAGDVAHSPNAGHLANAGHPTSDRSAASAEGAADPAHAADPAGAAHTARAADTTKTAASFNVHISRAIQIFESHLHDRITVAAVAAKIGVSQAHLTRLFTDHFGVSPLQYYRRVRMDVAASLLLNTTRSVKEIAWELGYSNPFHFSRSFRRYADMSPRAYREQYFRTNPTGYAGRIINV